MKLACNRSRLVLSRSISTLLLAVGCPVPPGAEAQSLNRPAVEAMGTAALPEVVVTAREERTAYRAETSTSATRLAAPILDTPRSVQVVTPQVIQDRAIIDPQEAVQNVSGVVRTGSRTGQGETYILRGYQQETLFKDGFRAGTLPGGEFAFEGRSDVANIDRIEVLKGPAAILFGRGEPGGVVNYVTKTPAFENRFSLQQQIGEYDFYRTQLGANWNAIPGRLALRADAAYHNTQSFIDFVESERWFVAPAFKLQIGPDTTLTFRGEFNHDDSSTTLAFPYANGEVVRGAPYNRYFGEPDFTNMHNETWRGLLTLDHRWNESHRTTASVHGVSSESDGGNFILFNFAGPLQDPITGDIARAAEIVNNEDEYFTARLEHVWDWTIYESAAPPTTSLSKDDKKVVTPISDDFAVKNQLLVSAEFDRQTVDGGRTLSGHTPLNPFNPHYTGYSPLPLVPGFPLTFDETKSFEAEAISLLILDRLSFGDTVHVSFGGRYEWFDGSSTLNFPLTVPFPSSASSQIEETFNPSAGLVVKPARNVSLYASYAESTNSFKNSGLSTATGAPLDAERARQYEAGVKVEFFGGKLFTTLALFQIEKTDVAGTDPSNPFFSINAGEERSRGVEFDIAGEPLPGWRILANYAYIDARVTDDPLADALGGTTGNRLPGVPEHSGGLFTTYEVQSGALKGLGFGGGVYLADRVEISRQNDGNLSGYAQTDLVLYYQREQWRAQLNMKNLFDNEFYYAGSFGFEAQRANARTFLATLKYEF